MSYFPGFVDLQVNGYRGIDFASPDLTAEDIVTIGQAMLGSGTVGYCPTVVTTSIERYEQSLPLLEKELRVRQMTIREPPQHLIHLRMSSFILLAIFNFPEKSQNCWRKTDMIIPLPSLAQCFRVTI